MNTKTQIQHCTTMQTNKTSILFFSIFFLFFSIFTTTSYGQCLTTELDVSTGVNHELGVLYAGDESDQYWTIDNAPTGFTSYPTPLCAKSWNNPTLNLIPPSRCISIVNSWTVSDANIGLPILGSCYDFGNAYQFIRKFKIDLPANTPFVPGSVDISYSADDYVTSANLFGPGGFFITMPTNTCPNTGVLTFNSGTVNFPPGVYVLSFSVRNKFVTNISNNNNPSFMNFELSGFINTQTFALVDNKHFGKNPICAPAYVNMDTPRVVGFCLPPSANSDTVTISNYNPVFTYTTTPATTVSSTGTFTGLLGTTYTVTVSDATGCTYNTVFKVTNGPEITVVSPLVCTQLGVPASVVFTATGGTLPYYEFRVTHGFYTTAINPTPISLFEGIYSIKVTDDNGCKDSVEVEVDEFSVNHTATSPICIGQSATLYADEAGFGNINNINLQWLGFSPTTGSSTQTVTPTSTTTYTVTGSDALGCTDVGTNTVVVNPLPQFTVTTSGQPCDITFTGNPLTPPNTPLPYSFAWYYTTTTPVVTNPFIPANFSPPPLVATNYTVTCTDANGCTSTSANLIYQQDPFCCNPVRAFTPTAQRFSNNTLYNNGNATAIIAAFGTSNTITTNANICLDGTITIDQSISFVNCPNIYLTLGTRINLTNGATLTITNSKMSALCQQLWNGIYATGATQLIIINNNTQIRDMENGVNANLGAIIRCTNSSFINNYTSMHLLNAPANYSINNNNCVIFGNQFFSTGALYFPRASNIKGEAGIRVTRCRRVEIGSMNNSVNSFSNLFCGVLIRSGNGFAQENYVVNNNTFTNITNVGLSDYSKLLWWSGGAHRGVGIYQAPIFPTINATLRVTSNPESVAFNFCDKAIFTNRASANVSWTTVANTLMGFMFNRVSGLGFTINNNNIHGSTVGIKFVGDANSGWVANNNIQPYNNFSTTNMYPVGIDVNYFTNTFTPTPIFPAPPTFTVQGNNITLISEAGVGINLTNTTRFTVVENNSIQYNVQNPAPQTATGACMALSNCLGTHINYNELHGNTTLLSPSNPNNIDGMLLSNSRDCFIVNNYFSHTRIGLRVLSDCSTNPAGSVSCNYFNMHGYGMLFGDLGTEATLGDIGTLIPQQDNHNHFTNASLFASGTFGIYRFGIPLSLPFGNRIFTSLIPINYSDANIFSEKYIIFNIPPSNDNCKPPTDIYHPMLAQPNATTVNIEEALDIANDSIVYPEFGAVAQWMNENNLYQAIAGNTTLLVNHADLAAFVASENLTHTDEIIQVNHLFNELADSTILTDSSQYASKMQQIETLNNTITGTNYLEVNERMVNSCYMKWQNDGIEGLTESETTFIETMALSCPFVNGTAVYKARTIYASIHPTIVYNDWTICHNNGVYKNGNSFSMDNLGTIDPILLQNIEHSVISIYPNPASTHITIDYALEYNEHATLALYDIIGKEQLKIDLLPSVNRVIANISGLKTGVYVYKYFTSTKTLQTGKLIIK